jgi:single-strand DNA-binding protein
MYQKIIIVGNLGGDPEMKYLENGTAITNFSVAVNGSRPDGKGGWEDETTWFRVTAWKAQAENAHRYLKKGSKVLVEGKLRPDPNTGSPRIWNRQDGTSAASYELNAENIKFLSTQSENAERDDSPAPAKNSAQRANPAPIEEDDIPF